MGRLERLELTSKFIKHHNQADIGPKGVGKVEGWKGGKARKVRASLKVWQTLSQPGCQMP